MKTSSSGRARMHRAADAQDSRAAAEQIANHFHVLASSQEVRSAEWERVRGPLGDVEQVNIRALMWFALPDGSYWSVQAGLAAGNLSDRPYWPRLMAGQTVLGDLVASKATGKSSAIVAVPVRDPQGGIVGVLGSSVYLDSLSLRIKQLENAVREMLTREEGVVNYRFRGKRRTVLYRRSHVSGWWYAFGHVWD